jgi:cyanophycinase
MHVSAAQNPGYEYYLVGNPEDVVKQTTPGLLLMGGSTDVDTAMQWMIEHSGGGDFLVIRASGTDAYNPYIYAELGGVDSAATLIIDHQRAAYDPFVIETIQQAEALFIAGGNQWDYVKLWKGTPVEDAIHAVLAKGAPVGGTSAGLAVLGEFAFSAERNTIVSSQALKNPYHPKITLETDFLSMPFLESTITDSHFADRDRMGRLVTFMARLLQDVWTEDARGIGIDGKTAIVVEAGGQAILHGAGSVYFLRATQMPQVCELDTPLTFRNIDVQRISGAGATFNLAFWSGLDATSYKLSAVEGELISNQPGGSIY